jgi:hypothetical protein
VIVTQVYSYVPVSKTVKLRNSALALDVYKPQDVTEPPPGFAPTATGGKEFSSVWAQYNQKAESFDSDLIKDANNTVEVLLVFVSSLLAVINSSNWLDD